MKTRNIKLQDMAILLEFLVGSGLAIFFHLVLHYEQQAYTIFAVAILLSLATYLVREDVDKTKTALMEQFSLVHEIPSALSKIADPECHAKAHELLASTRKTIALLQRGSIPLEETEFYMEGARLADQTTRHIKAVTPLDLGSMGKGAVVNFYQSNLRAVERGVRITRIFVTNRSDLAEPEFQKLLLAQRRDAIDVRYALREELPTTSGVISMDSSSSFDFVLFDDRIMTNVLPQPGKHYGRKTCQLTEVSKYRHLFDLIEHGSYAISVIDDKIQLSPKSVA